MKWQSSASFVPVPDFLELDKRKLKYYDAFIYASIRSYNDSDTNKCYPSFKTLIKRSGCSRDFINGSIKRLESAKYITVKHSKDREFSNDYEFPNDHRVELLPNSLLDSTDLSLYEKGMLICLRQFFNHGVLTSFETIGSIAKHMGLTYKTVHKQYEGLRIKGYIVRVTRGKLRLLRLTNKLDWGCLEVCTEESCDQKLPNAAIKGYFPIVIK